MISENTKCTILCILMISYVFSAGCATPEAAGSGEEVAESSDEHVSNQLPDDLVILPNSSYSEEFASKDRLLNELINIAITESIPLITSDLPLNYETLISSGAIPVIPANRYTGKDVVNTPDYSPGDIYFELDAENEISHYYRYMGPLDLAYKPDAVPAGERRHWSGEPEAETDGKALYIDAKINLEWFQIDQAAHRRLRGIPEGDMARSRMYVLNEAMTCIVRAAGMHFDEPPETLDGYIDFVGRRNPIAWINPYTGEEMKSVPWIMPHKMFAAGSEYNEPMPESLGAGENDELSIENLVGNYAYKVIPSESMPEAKEAHILFYYYLPNKKLGAYYCVGMSKPYLEKGFDYWIEHVLHPDSGSEVERYSITK